ncbi:hypothetical protein GH714_034151 [Hevea brasiliensis]|uniref:Uncharacterized protein n=1 Tax=Hevea brasiliensis TaxID=3981 RepID=A0A6A6K847_HEVBR|nr:hypothetical protein GH714_034151 [Hevea brasiliensis]
MKRLTWNEMQKRRAQGLCFNCDEKFTTRHHCKGPQLLILDGEAEDAGTDEQDDSKVFQPKISLYALSRWTTQKTIDRMANVLHLPATPIKPFDVKVADGKPLTCRGKFDNVNILIQGIPFALTLYALPVNGLDVVLGIHWLAQLGMVGKLEWPKEADKAFQELKKAMTTTPTLAMPNFQEPFVIEAYASGEGIVDDDGDVLKEPEAVLDTRWVKKGSKLVEQSLIKWKHLPTEEATWKMLKTSKTHLSTLRTRSVILFLSIVI